MTKKPSERDIAAMRRNYTRTGLTEQMAGADPFALFEQWFDVAVQTNPGDWYEPNVMSLATVAPDGTPSNRIVLLKGYDTHGFVFFTNYESRKADEITQNPNVALCFHWPQLERQVRIVGAAARIDRAANEDYFATRPRGSRLGAWVSSQSLLTTLGELRSEFDRMTKEFDGHDIPCPPNWGGYRVTPTEIEFWQGRPNRMHDRIHFERDGDTWRRQRLAP